MRFLCGLIKSDAERQILFKIIGKEGVMTFSGNFACSLRRAHRCAVVSGMHLMTERLTNRSCEFRALTAGDTIERLELFTIGLVLENACRCLGQWMRGMDEDISVIETTSIAKLFRWRPFLLSWLPDQRRKSIEWQEGKEVRKG